jgi:hypothetical protein
MCREIALSTFYQFALIHLSRLEILKRWCYHVATEAFNGSVFIRAPASLHQHFIAARPTPSPAASVL